MQEKSPMPSLLPPAAASSGRLWSQPATTPRSVEGNGFYWAGLLSLSLLSLLLGGCFSRGYETGYSAAVERYRTASEYARLQPQPVALAGDTVKLRYPRFFTTQIDPEKDNGETALPSFLRGLPGVKVAFETLIDMNGTKIPVVLTLGVVPAGEKSREEIEADILEQVRKEESFGAAQWTKTREETDFTGAAKRWDVLELKGPQSFLCDVGGKREPKGDIPAVCEIWVSAEPRQDVCTILVWRVPDQAADKFPLAELAPLTARTLVVEAPQEAAAAEPAPQP